MKDQFTPPKTRVAEAATKKRITLIESVINALADCSSSVLLTGTMAYGQDYSVTPESPVNLELTVTMDLMEKLATCKFFQKYNIKRIADGIRTDVFQSFTLSFMVKEVPFECRFWYEETYKNVLRYKKESIVRLRSQTRKSYTDIACSFDGEEREMIYDDYKSDVYNVGVLPIWHEENGKLFLSSPLTDALANSIVLFDDCNLTPLIVSCRDMTEKKISEIGQVEGTEYSIYNTIAKKEKVSEEVQIMLT